MHVVGSNQEDNPTGVVFHSVGWNLFLVNFEAVGEVGVGYRQNGPRTKYR